MIRAEKFRRAAVLRTLAGACAALLVSLLATPVTAFGLGSFSGKVTAAVGGQPLVGVEVCGESVGVTDIRKCAATAGDGKYKVEGLEPGNYKVEFRPSVVSGYLPQFYKDSLGKELVEVVNAADIFGVDAALQREELAGSGAGGAVTPVNSGADSAPAAPPSPVTGPPAAAVPKPTPKACRRGWRKVRVKGQVRCRKVPRRGKARGVAKRKPQRSAQRR